MLSIKIFYFKTNKQILTIAPDLLFFDLEFSHYPGCVLSCSTTKMLLSDQDRQSTFFIDLIEFQSYGKLATYGCWRKKGKAYRSPYQFSYPYQLIFLYLSKRLIHMVKIQGHDQVRKVGLTWKVFWKRGNLRVSLAECSIHGRYSIITGKTEKRIYTRWPQVVAFASTFRFYEDQGIGKMLRAPSTLPKFSVCHFP